MFFLYVKKVTKKIINPGLKNVVEFFNDLLINRRDLDCNRSAVAMCGINSLCTNHQPITASVSTHGWPKPRRPAPCASRRSCRPTVTPSLNPSLATARRTKCRKTRPCCDRWPPPACIPSAPCLARWPIPRPSPRTTTSAATPLTARRRLRWRLSSYSCSRANPTTWRPALEALANSFHCHLQFIVTHLFNVRQYYAEFFYKSWFPPKWSAQLREFCQPGEMSLLGMSLALAAHLRPVSDSDQLHVLYDTIRLY